MSNDPFSTGTTLDLGHLYESNVERTAYHTQLFRELYNLPFYRLEENVTPELYAYCEKRDYFVNIIAFQSRRIFLKRSLDTGLGWALPGSGILSKKDELYQDAVYRIMSRDIPNVEIGELRPIAYLEKTYKHGKKSITHHGITFLGRVRYPSQEELARNEDIKGRFISIDDSEEKKRICQFDAELFDLASSLIKNQRFSNYDTIEAEIESFGRITNIAQKVHKYLVSPFGKRFSSQQIKNEILKYVKPTDYYLDIACGDDDFIWQVAEKAQFCIANDVQWKLIQKLISLKKSNAHKVAFVNHDACDLPFKRQFDLVLCKNMLHHMADKDHLVGLLSNLREIAKRILIVDPEDPSASKLARLWHCYYARLLKDRGEKFFKMDFLEKTMREFYTDASSINIKRIRTIKGYYMLCHIEFPFDNMKNISLSLKQDRKDYRISKILEGTKLIIFDFDGLLFDTERLFLRAVQETAQGKGVKIRTKDYIARDLQSGSSIFKYLFENRVIQNPDKLQEEVYDKYGHLVSQGVQEMPGAMELINKLRGRYELAIASSSKRAYINIILKAHNLYDSFSMIVSRENTKHHKPDPECLKLILNKLNLRSDECVLVEDTVRGLNAAKAIGMKCIIIPNEMTRQGDFYGADVILGSLAELSSHI